MNKKELEKRLAEIPEVEPDEWDLAMMRKAEKDDDGVEITLEEFNQSNGYTGRITLRVPKSMHYNLATAAKAEGVSLNQYILYKLAQK